MLEGLTTKHGQFKRLIDQNGSFSVKEVHAMFVALLTTLLEGKFLQGTLYSQPV